MKASELKELHIVTRGRCADGQGEYEMVVIARRMRDEPGQGMMVKKISGDTMAATNNEAHYHAVIAAVEYLDNLANVPSTVPLFIHTPSEIVAGEKNAKADHLASLNDQVAAIIGRIHIQRLPAAETRQVLAM